MVSLAKAVSSTRQWYELDTGTIADVDSHDQEDPQLPARQAA
jgi:hypothetical protein